MIRTQRIPLIQSTAAAPVLLMTGIVLAIGMAIPFTSLGASVGLQPLRINYFPWFIATTAELLPAHPHYKDHLHPKVRPNGFD
jgi:hypothetical protein